LAGAIGNSAEIEIKRGSWFEPAIAWVVVIASSGTKKSPAIKAATAGVRAEQKRLNETHNNDKKKYDLESASYNAMEKDKRPLEKPQAPRLRHAYTTNATIEALAERLQYSSGMLLVSDELSGFLSSFGEYKNARNSDVQGYLSMFSGVQLKIDRKTSEQPTIQIERPNVSIAGGIQPGIAKRIFKPEYFDNGLIARFLVVAPPEMFSGYTDAEIDPAVRRGFDALFEELYARASGNTQTMRLTPDALALWKSFQDAHALETKAMFHERLREAWSKLEGYCARFALILQAVENATAHSFESEITANVMQRAIELCRWFAYETRRAYSILSGDQHAVEQDSLIGWIYGQGGRVTARQLQRHSRQYQNSEQAKAALHTLVDAGSGHWEYPGPANKGGAPSEIFVLGTTNNNGPAAANPPQPGAVPATLPGTNSIFAVDNTATKGVSGGFVSVNAVGSPPKLRLPPPRRVSKPGNVTKSNGDENHD
jgi:hypothetical protein